MNKSIFEKDLEQYKVKKGNQTTFYSGSDLRISEVRHQNKKCLNFTFYHKIFSQYRYITFYVVDNALLMKLSDKMSADSYTITHKQNGYYSKISGKAYEAIKKFVGTYDKVMFYNNVKSEPIMYVEV